MTTATGATARDPGRETSPWPALSPQERGDRGRAARREVPRSVHAAWAPAPDRRAPVDILEEQSADRLPDLVAVRYGRMLESPFAFFRGAAGLMAPDLAHTPVSGLHAHSAATPTSRTSAASPRPSASSSSTSTTSTR